MVKLWAQICNLVFSGYLGRRPTQYADSTFAFTCVILKNKAQQLLHIK